MNAVGLLVAVACMKKLTTLHLESFSFANQIFSLGKAIVGIEICQDLWTPREPSVALALKGANIILNLSASNEVVGKAAYRRKLVEIQSQKLHCAYVFLSAGVYESTKDTSIFWPHFIC